MDVNTNLVMWSGIVGFFMPIVISVIQQPSWSSQVRSLVMFVASIIAAVGTVFFEGKFTGVDLATALLTVMTVTIATYTGFWKQTGVAPKLEMATSPGSGSA